MYSLNYCEKKIYYYLAKSGPLIIKFNANLIFLGGHGDERVCSLLKLSIRLNLQGLFTC